MATSRPTSNPSPQGHARRFAATGGRPPDPPGSRRATTACLAADDGATGTSGSCPGHRRSPPECSPAQGAPEVRIQIDVIVASGETKYGTPSSMPSPSNHPAITLVGKLCSAGLGVRGVINCRRVKCTRQPKIGIVSKTTAPHTKCSRATHSTNPRTGKSGQPKRGEASPTQQTAAP